MQNIELHITTTPEIGKEILDVMVMLEAGAHSVEALRATQKPTAVPTLSDPSDYTQIFPPIANTAVPTVTPVPVQLPPAYTQDQLAQAAIPLMDTGRQGELQAVLAHFGVPAITLIPPERYGEFATALRALGARI